MTEPRPYHQVARATAAEATRSRIVASFRKSLLAHWMDEITLDAVAADAGTTRQTVIRMFGSKEGLLIAVANVMKDEIDLARAVAPGASPRAAARALVSDYENSGDIVIRILAQEARHTALTALLDVGRKAHRHWVEATFGPAFGRRKAEAARLVTELVAVTDVYVWKLLRRDLGLATAEVETLIADMVTKLLREHAP